VGSALDPRKKKGVKGWIGRKGKGGNEEKEGRGVS